MSECQLNVRMLKDFKNKLKKEAMELGITLRKYISSILANRK
jgi:hypothetical protein